MSDAAGNGRSQRKRQEKHPKDAAASAASAATTTTNNNGKDVSPNQKNNVENDKSNSHMPFPFRLPPEFTQDPDRFELWTVRVPMLVKLKDMEGCRILPSTAGAASSNSDDALQSSNDGLFTASSAPSNGSSKNPSEITTYALIFGHGAENESLRLMIPRRQLNGDQEESEAKEEERDTVLMPLRKEFSRHLNVLEHHEARTEQQLAPRVDEAPSADAGSALRRAYTSVPQKAGLKRRWQLPGSSTVPIPSQYDSFETKRKRSNTARLEETILNKEFESEQPLVDSGPMATKSKGDLADERRAEIETTDTHALESHLSPRGDEDAQARKSRATSRDEYERETKRLKKEAKKAKKAKKESKKSRKEESGKKEKKKKDKK